LLLSTIGSWAEPLPALVPRWISLETPGQDSRPQPDLVREFILIRYGDLEEIRALLATLFPDVEYAVDAKRGGLNLKGAPDAVAQAKEVLVELDREVDFLAVARTAGAKAARKASLPPPRGVSVQGVRLGDLREHVRRLVGVEPSFSMEPVTCAYGIYWAFKGGPAVRFYKWEQEFKGAMEVEGSCVELGADRYRTQAEVERVLGPPALRRNEEQGFTEDYFEADNLALRYRDGVIVKAWLDCHLGDRIRDEEVPYHRNGYTHWPRPLSEIWFDDQTARLLDAKP